MIKLISIWEFLELGPDEQMIYLIDTYQWLEDHDPAKTFPVNPAYSEAWHDVNNALTYYKTIHELAYVDIIYKDRFRDRWMIKERIDSE